MKCIKCTAKNINSANYCRKCGNKFLEEEQKAAKRWTLVWFLEWIDKIKSLWKFSFITDHILFKIASVLVVLAIGIHSLITNGSHLKIEENTNYKIQHNTKLSEYYLIIQTDETELNLYIPKEAEGLTVYHSDKNNQLIEKATYSTDDKIILETNTTLEDFYLIEAEYDEDSKESIKVYIYKEEGEV